MAITRSNYLRTFALGSLQAEFAYGAAHAYQEAEPLRSTPQGGDWHAQRLGGLVEVRRRGIVLIAVEELEADLARRGMADVLHEQVERNLSEPCIGQLR